MKECQRMSEGRLEKSSTLRKKLAMVYNSPFVKSMKSKLRWELQLVCLQIRFREGTFWANYMQIPKLEWRPLRLFWKDFPYYVWGDLRSLWSCAQSSHDVGGLGHRHDVGGLGHHPYDDHDDHHRRSLRQPLLPKKIHLETKKNKAS